MSVMTRRNHQIPSWSANPVRTVLQQTQKSWGYLWLYQLYLYFSSLKHIKPHFWGVGSTLKHSSFSKKHGQFHSIHTLEPVIFLSHFIFSIELNAFPIRFSTKFTKTWTSAGRSAGASAYAPSSPDSVAAAEQPPGRLSHGLHKSRGGGVTMRM